jgi:hypothetical protein
MTKLILAFVSSLAIGLCSSPLASVANEGPFVLNEQTVSARGVQSWPLLTGDRIVTAATPALISFHDGSTISLSPNSALRLSGSEREPVAVLESGALDYNIAKDSKLLVSKLSEASHQASAPHLVNHATVGAVVAASLAGVGTIVSRMAGTAGNAAPVSAAASPLLSKPPPISHFQ